MPREGIFAKVLEAGYIKTGDNIEILWMALKEINTENH